MRGPANPQVDYPRVHTFSVLYIRIYIYTTKVSRNFAHVGAWAHGRKVKFISISALFIVCGFQHCSLIHIENVLPIINKICIFFKFKAKLYCGSCSFSIRYINFCGMYLLTGLWECAHCTVVARSLIILLMCIQQRYIFFGCVENQTQRLVQCYPSAHKELN